MRERARETGAAALEAAVARFIRGKPEAVELASACLLAGGHLLIEDVPGVGKTTLAQALARAVDGTFQRVQCTADMLPSDILGVRFSTRRHANSSSSAARFSRTYCWPTKSIERRPRRNPRCLKR